MEGANYEDSFKISALTKLKNLNDYFEKLNISPNKINDEKENCDVKDSLKSMPKSSLRNSKTMTSNNLYVQKIFREVVKESEKYRREAVCEGVGKKFQSFVQYDKEIKQKNKSNWDQRKRNLLNKTEAEEIGILKFLQKNEQEEIKKQQAISAYNQHVKERHKQNEQILKMNEEKKIRKIEIINKIKKYQREFREVYQEIVTIIRNFKQPTHTKIILEDIKQLLQSLPNLMNEIVERCEVGNIEEKDVKKSEECIIHIKNLKDIISKRIETIENKKEEVEVVKQEEPKVTNVVPTNEKINNDKEYHLNMGHFTTKSSIQYYTELQSFLQNYSNLFKNLIENNCFKQFRFECKKAVNIPVNAISAVNSSHLLDKYERLRHLLEGNKVLVGETEVIASKHPEGIAFCMDLLAKKFVLQGDLMISSNQEAVFPYATIILSLWNRFPEFGRLFLLHLHRECTYLIPFYPPKIADQSDEDYYKSLGYKYIDGVIEKQDKFLKRMSGIMTLYAAIVISKPKGDQEKSPHNISNGWRWLASILNLEPRLDITATMIHTFLEISGFAMQNVYGKQFHKVIMLLCEHYLPLIKRVDSGGPVTRLEVLLQKYQNCGRFDEPKGILPYNFW